MNILIKWILSSHRKINWHGIFSRLGIKQLTFYENRTQCTYCETQKTIYTRTVWWNYDNLPYEGIQTHKLCYSITLTETGAKKWLAAWFKLWIFFWPFRLNFVRNKLLSLSDFVDGHKEHLDGFLCVAFLFHICLMQTMRCPDKGVGAFCKLKAKILWIWNNSWIFNLLFTGAL